MYHEYCYVICSIQYLFTQIILSFSNFYFITDFK